MYRLIRPLLFRLDAEVAHRCVIKATAMTGPLGRAMFKLRSQSSQRSGSLNVGGLKIKGFVGLAAGLDKDGELAKFWPEVGFGLVELGTVTAVAQAGNPKPRLFRYPQQSALINRMGFNNAGSEALARRLDRLRNAGWKPSVPIGVNIGKSRITPLDQAVEDYVVSAKRLYQVVDYLAINVSSPNTPGLRRLQNEDDLKSIVDGVRSVASDCPIFVKLAPDMDDSSFERMAIMLEKQGVNGLIATNTTTERYGLRDAQNVDGGLSGKPLAKRAQKIVNLLSSCCRLPIVGVGGVGSVDDVNEMLDAGASFVQLYTAMIFKGPDLIRELNEGLMPRWKQCVNAENAIVSTSQ